MTAAASELSELYTEKNIHRRFIIGVNSRAKVRDQSIIAPQGLHSIRDASGCRVILVVCRGELATLTVLMTAVPVRQ